MVSGDCFFFFFVHAFCMRLLNSIHDEIGNRSSLSCWVCLDFSPEIAVQTNHSKGMYKGHLRKKVCLLFGRQKHMASWTPQFPPSFEFTFALPPKNEKRLPPKHYHRIALPPKKYRPYFGLPLPPKSLPPYCITAEKIPPYFGLPLPPKSLPPKNEKPPTARKLPLYGNTAPPVSA